MASEAIPILEGFSTQSLHQFRVPAGNTFDDPVTPEGKVWRAALKSLSKVDGWSAAWWGRREECVEEVELILGWKNHHTFEAFFGSSVWTSFSETIAPLTSTALKTICAVQFSPSVMTGISAWPEGLTSIHRIQFPAVLSLPERNNCELSVFSYVQSLHNRPRTSSLEVEGLKGGATGWAIPMPIPGQKDEKGASENDGNILNSTFVILMSWKDAEAEKAGEAFTNSSMDESLYEHHIQPMIRRAGPGTINSHLKLDFLSEYNLEFEERSSVLLARYWDDVETGVNKSLLDEAQSKNEYPEEANFSSETNDSSSSGNSTSDSDESAVEEILRNHPPPGTYSPLIERSRDSPDNSPPDSSSEEEEEEGSKKEAPEEGRPEKEEPEEGEGMEDGGGPEEGEGPEGDGPGEEEPEDEPAPKGVAQKDSGVDETDLKDPSTTSEPGRETT